MALLSRLENLRMREGGCAVDRIVLTTDAAFIPTGVGPEETLRDP